MNPLVNVPEIPATFTIRVEPESIKRLAVSIGVMLVAVSIVAGLVRIIVNKI